MPTANRNRTPRKAASAAGGETTPHKATTQPPTKAIVTPMQAEREAAEGIERIGDILRRRRQQRGDDLQHIADYLCIRKGFLAALENSDYAELPADAYAVGFLRSYATYLGFDGVDAINRYRGEMAGRRRKPSLAMPTPIAEGRTPSGFIMIAAAVAAILIYAAWYGYTAATRSSVNMSPMLPAAVSTDTAGTIPLPPVPPPSSEGIKLPAPAEPAAVVAPAVSPPIVTTQEHAKPATEPTTASKEPTPATTETPAEDATASSAGSHLVLRAEKETWVHVADSKDTTVFDRVMKPGDTYAVPDTEGLKLTTGNSSGIVLVLDGKDLPKLARNSSILHDVPLDISKLKTVKGKPAKAASKLQE